MTVKELICLIFGHKCYWEANWKKVGNEWRVSFPPALPSEFCTRCGLIHIKEKDKPLSFED